MDMESWDSTVLRLRPTVRHISEVTCWDLMGRPTVTLLIACKGEACVEILRPEAILNNY